MPRDKVSTHTQSERIGELKHHGAHFCPKGERTANKVFCLPPHQTDFSERQSSYSPSAGDPTGFSNPHELDTKMWSAQ